MQNDTFLGMSYVCVNCVETVTILDSAHICSDCGAICCSTECLAYHLEECTAECE